MSHVVPTITLNSGAKMPQFGLGTWKSKPGQVLSAVEHALMNGYNHIDGALVYENEKEVGQAIKKVIDSGKMKREDIWVTSKLWNTMRAPESIKPALEKTLTDLGLSYVDLYLIHWPVSYRAGANLFPMKEKGVADWVDINYVDVWKSMESLVEAGLAKNIGVSNFNHKQIDEILASCKIAPAVNQVELHPYLSQEKLVQYCKEKNIAVTGYAPLGAPDFANPEEPVLLQDETVKKIAEKHGRSPANICIRYALERGIISIPKSVTPSRIDENLTALTFKLDEDDQAALMKLNRNYRYYAGRQDRNSPQYAFNAEY